jgi:hypothetical protein
MRMVFLRGDGPTYTVHIHRPDGVVVAMPGVGARWRVPHDLAHVATERALGMAGGVFGSAASGAMFDGMSVVSGRLRHDPKQRSRDILRTNTKARTITVAEVMASLVHGVVEHGSPADRLYERARTSWGTVREDPFPFTPAQLQAAVDDLRRWSDRWADTAAGETLEVDWPDDLVSAARDGRTTRKSGSAGRSRMRGRTRGLHA